MANWTAYYDASGSEAERGDDKRLVVAGLLATETRWLKFEKEWGDVLKEFAVPHLHMKEFVHSKPPFENWKGDEDRRGRFLGSLTRVVKRRVNRMWIAHMRLGDFNEVNETYQLREAMGGPYSYSASMCLGQIRNWMQRKHSGEPLQHVFEAGDEGQKLFRAVMEADSSLPTYPTLRRKIDPQSGEWFKPFQAADFAAYEFATELERIDQREKRTRPSRQSWIGLFKHIPHIIKEHNTTTLTRICVERPDLFPRRA
jgi:hypothetical protein